MPFSGFVGSMLGGVVPDYLAGVLDVSLAQRLFTAIRCSSGCCV